MRRVIVIVGVLCVVLAIALTVRMRQLNAYKTAPAGGTGTIEGTEVNITARIGARITAVNVREGDTAARPASSWSSSTAPSPRPSRRGQGARWRAPRPTCTRARGRGLGGLGKHGRGPARRTGGGPGRAGRGRAERPERRQGDRAPGRRSTAPAPSPPRSSTRWRSRKVGASRARGGGKANQEAASGPRLRGPAQPGRGHRPDRRRPGAVAAAQAAV